MKEILKNKNKGTNEVDLEYLIRKYECFVAIGLVLLLIFACVLVYYISKDQPNYDSNRTTIVDRKDNL